MAAKERQMVLIISPGKHPKIDIIGIMGQGSIVLAQPRLSYSINVGESKKHKRL
ncbi:MAG: hypothetical protein ACYCT2_01365 [Thermoplasmataceae archaeon]